MDQNLPTPDPRERLLNMLHPQGDIDHGLAVTVANQLGRDAQQVLAELIDKEVTRRERNAFNDGYDFAHKEIRADAERLWP